MKFKSKNNYYIFQTIRRTTPNWEGNGGASYSLNVAYLALGGQGWAVVEWGHCCRKLEAAGMGRC